MVAQPDVEATRRGGLFPCQLLPSHNDGRWQSSVGRIRSRAEPRQRSAAHKACADGFVVKLEYPGLWNIVIM